MKVIQAVGSAIKAVIWVGKLPGRIIAGFFDALERVGRVIGKIVRAVVGLIVVVVVSIISLSIAYGISGAVMTWSPIASFTARSVFLTDAVRVIAFLLACGVIILVLWGLFKERTPDELMKSWAEQDYKRAAEERRDRSY